MAAYQDYYKTLEVTKGASQEEIRRAFRKLAAKHHPDRNPGDPGAEERFKQLNEAYTVLSDEEKRKFYDQYGAAGAPPFGQAAYPPGGAGFGGPGGRVYTNVSAEEFAGFSDFFQSLFGGFAGRTGAGSGPFAAGEGFGRSQAGRLPEAEARLDVGLLEAYAGGPTKIRLSGKELELSLPKGVRDGAKLRLKGQAPQGGDLILQVKHLPHPTLKLEGDNVRAVARVPDHLAALGGTTSVDGLGGKLDITVPSGSSTGRVLRLRGQGWPKTSGGRGDAMIELRVTVPEDLSAEQRRLYQRLAAAAAGDVGADGESDAA